MTLPQVFVFVTIGLMMLAFIWGRWRYDVVAVGALLAAMALGIVPPAEAFSGFSDDIVIIVGSALVVRLAERGHRVIGFGHGSSYAALRPRLPEGVTLVSGDLADGDVVRKAVRGVDAVVHSGSVTGEASCRRDLSAAVRTIVRGTRMVVEGTVGVHKTRLAILNPSYRLLG